MIMTWSWLLMRNQQSKAKKCTAKILSETKPDSRILAVFGPEGGLSRDEVDYFVEHKGILCGLGPRILRTETAPLYLVLLAINGINESFFQLTFFINKEYRQKELKK